MPEVGRYISTVIFKRATYYMSYLYIIMFSNSTTNFKHIFWRFGEFSVIIIRQFIRKAEDIRKYRPISLLPVIFKIFPN